MGLPKYSQRNATSKSGVNHVRIVVESCNSIFHEIHQENDIGIDGIIEIIKGEHPTGKMLALQIKSGESFFVRGECTIPTENHAKYWSNHHLPVFGIVYVPTLANAYRVDIKKYLSQNKEASIIKYAPTRANTFDVKDFQRVFVPHILEQPPTGFSLEDALGLFHSSNNDEAFLGLLILFREFTDNNKVWDEFVNYLRQTSAHNIPNVFPYFLAHIPWHPDIWGGKDKITSESRAYAKLLFESLEKAEIIKLLSKIDNKGIDRGTVGQSVEAIISSLPQSKMCLLEITLDKEIDVSIREYAATLLAYKWPQEIFPALETIAHESSTMDWIVSELREHGSVMLY